jgi:hypothetical protein
MESLFAFGMASLGLGFCVNSLLPIYFGRLHRGGTLSRKIKSLELPKKE